MEFLQSVIHYTMKFAQLKEQQDNHQVLFEHMHLNINK